MKRQCQFGWDWAPRLVTAGIWRDIRVDAWSGHWIETVRITQRHDADGSVTLEFAPELARMVASAHCRGMISLEGRVVATIEHRLSKIEDPNPWWPNGHGPQPLYEVRFEVEDASGGVHGPWTRRIGLRSAVLDRHTDQWGESSQFLINGRPTFAKGANWIPAILRSPSSAPREVRIFSARWGGV